MRPIELAHSLEGRYEIETGKGCWIWSGSAWPNGYGKVHSYGKTYAAHRVSYELHKGPIPEGMFVCHRCDVRLCINPEHLFLGTHSDNMADMAKKKRSTHGENHAMKRLTKEDVWLIRQDGRPHRAIGRAFGISGTQVKRIKDRKCWVHV